MQFVRAVTILCTTAVATAAWAQTGNIAVNQTGAAADPKAILDVSSTTMGLLIPRMSEAQRNNITAPAEGLLIYQTNGTPRGFHVMHGGTWTPLLQGKNGWDLWGNHLLNGGDPTPDFIGTTDARSMMFRTNNIHRMQLDYATGYMAVGHPINTGAAGAAKERLDINGALGLYYYRGGNPPSNTYDAGVFRYQPFGTLTGTGDYQYGTYELGPTSPNNGATWNVVYGSNKPSPLMHAAHWGNINGMDTVRGKVVATAPPTITQPQLGGWRAFENPYEERIGMPWDHPREPVCQAGAQVSIPYGWAPNTNGGVWSNDAALTADDQRNATPYIRQGTGINPYRVRRQYLFFAEELHAELAQEKGVAGVSGGLCRDEPINEIAFWVNGNGVIRTIAAGQGHVIVRHAPPGLDQLVGFDNTPDHSGNIGCGAITSTWPDGTGNHWHPINLTTPFYWDGESNIIVEVAFTTTPGPAGPPAPVAVQQLSVPVTFAATANNIAVLDYTPLPNPYPPGPGWACPNLFTPPTTNNGLLLPDFGTNPMNYLVGSSTWRPVVRFGGTVASSMGGALGNSALGDRYINFTGALVMEDPNETGRINSLSPGLPWGRWRFNFPPGNPTFNYKGDGTISAQKGVFDNNSRLHDHVFDRHFDGRVAPLEAAEFGDQRTLSIPEMAAFTRDNRHLPTMKGRTDWNRTKGFSVGDLTNQLWATAETHALYVADLHDKLNVLEMLSTDRPLTENEFLAALKELATMPEYNDAEKARLITDLRQRTPSLSR